MKSAATKRGLQALAVRALGEGAVVRTKRRSLNPGLQFAHAHVGLAEVIIWAPNNATRALAAALRAIAGEG